MTHKDTTVEHARRAPNVSANGIQGRRRVEKIAEVVARELLGQIRERGLQPGDRLPPETTMLETFDVARGSLREALRILEVYGLLRIQPGPGGGPVVREMGAREYARLLSFCMSVGGTTYGGINSSAIVMEAMLVRESAQRRDPEQMATIRAALAAADTDDSPAFGLAMREFHQAIVSAPGAELLATFLRSMEEAIAIRLGNAISIVEAREIVDVHHAIADAIFRGDGELAASLTTEHRRGSFDRYEQTFPGLGLEEVRWI
jgi:GntR family transcriptional repressor for pyruvate dehydrogenase complex